jgi:hypothetical protein
MKTRFAEIISIVDDYSAFDSLGYSRRYTGHVKVQDATGEIHFMLNGSMNQVPPEQRCVGKKGTVSYTTLGSVAFWHWQPEKANDVENHR